MKQKAFPEFKSKKALLNTFFFLVVSYTQNGFWTQNFTLHPFLWKEEVSCKTGLQNKKKM